MRVFFEECAHNPANCANNYLPEALRRTIVQEIVVAMDELGIVSQAVDRKVRETDSKLRRIVRPSGFIWAEDLAAVYPADIFWWLYSRPSSAPDLKD
jgi:hypothetical protein